MQYSIDYNLPEVPDKDGMIQCRECSGTGHLGYQVTKDESDVTPCDTCEGTGRAYPYEPEVEK